MDALISDVGGYRPMNLWTRLRLSLLNGTIPQI